MNFIHVPRTFLVGLAMGTFALAATAQWQWTDKDGRKVYSDRPPPADIQEKDILKRPGGLRGAVVVTPVASVPDAAAINSAPDAAVKGNAPKLPVKDKELEARKKQAETQEAAKKKAEEEKLAQVKAENCDRARKAQVTLDSGVRVATTNAKGEREIMDDKARAAETKRQQGIIASDCS